MGRMLLLVVGSVAAVLGVATPASSLVLPFQASLAIELGNVPAVVIASTGVAALNGSGGGGALASLDLGAGAVGGGPVFLPVTDPGVGPIEGLIAEIANGAGHFATGGGALGGVMPLPGFYKVCLFGSCDAAPPANLTIPLTPIGVGGQVTAMGAVSLTVYGAPWTGGTASIGVVTRMGYAMGPGSATGSTAQIGGKLQLVTPIYVTTSIGASAVAPAFAVLTLHFVPEPATLGLLASGVAGLAWVGARRR